MSVPTHTGRGLRRHEAAGMPANAEALRFAETAVQIEGQDAFNRYALGPALTLVRQHDEAVFELGKALERYRRSRAKDRAGAERVAPPRR